MEFYYTISRDDVRPYIPEVPILLPASSYWRNCRLRVPSLPTGVNRRAADCGGFVFATKGCGYEFSISQLSDWYTALRVEWGAMLDYPCERELCVSTRQRQIQTTLQVHRTWEYYRDAPFAWVPTVQGFTTEEYRRHARELAPVIRDMQRHYGAHGGFRVGIGSLCRRTKKREIQHIISAVAQEIHGVPLHLWGVKLGLFRGRDALHPQVASADSAAWNGAFGKDLDKQRQERQRLGLTKRQYHYRVCLPDYQRKVSEALAGPKQVRMEL